MAKKPPDGLTSEEDQNPEEDKLTEKTEDKNNNTSIPKEND